MAEEAAVSPAPEQSAEQRLVSFFVRDSKAPQAAAAAPVESESEAAPPEAPVEVLNDAPDGGLLADESESEAEPAAPEPEFDIEVDGRVERITGTEKVKELLQKGLDYSNKTAAAAREREMIASHAQMLSQAAQFQQQVLGDLADVRAIDNQLQQFQAINWNQVYDTDPVQGLKLNQQRQALLELRTAKLGELQQKQHAFLQGQAQAAQQTLAAEAAALTAKLPAWRNSETASREKAELREYLLREGYNPSEVGNLSDHRLLITARKAWLYDQLQAQAKVKSKEVREAPPVVKPGSANTQQTAARAKQQELRQRLRKSGDVKDAAALIYSRMK